MDKFDIVKYLHLHQKMEEKIKEKMAITVESAHPTFGTQTAVKVEVPQVNLINIKAMESIKLPEFTQAGIAVDANSKIERYIEPNQSFEWRKGSFHLFYPIIRQV